MNKLTAKELRNLKYGDKVYRFDGRSMRGFDFVGLMPSCKNYLILSDGETLIHLHISDKDESFRYDWYSGKYDSVFAGNLMIQYHKKEIETITEVFIKD